MKRCPECRRDYYDDTLLYCLDDGSALLDGPASADEPATAILSEPRAEAGGLTRLTGHDDEPKTSIFTSVESSTSNSNSIAVLPFVNISADAENEYFCDGLAEELLNALSKIDELKVAARTSAFSFKGKNTNVREIGEMLSVKTVLEGSVRKSGNKLRISVQLVNATDGYHLWSERYDREMQDIFEVQDEIALAVIDALKLKIFSDEKEALLKRYTDNAEAYKAYLRGRHLRYAKNDHLGAALAFEEAVGLDPTHAPSWIGVAETLVLRAHYGLIDPREACLKTKVSLETARNIQGESPEALYVEGFAAFIERNWSICENSYLKAIQLDPNNSRTLGTYGVINCVLGRIDDALNIFESARNADPLAAYPYAMTGTGLVAARRLDEAMPFFEQAFTFENDQTLALWSFCVGCIGLGRFNDGIAAAVRAVAVSGRAGFFVGLLGWALAASGRTDEAKTLLKEIQDRPPNSPVLAWEACILGVLGDKDRAFELLLRSIDEFAPLSYYIGLPCFDSLRGDPRFAAMVKRLNMPE